MEAGNLFFLVLLSRRNDCYTTTITGALFVVLDVKKRTSMDEAYVNGKREWRLYTFENEKKKIAENSNKGLFEGMLEIRPSICSRRDKRLGNTREAVWPPCASYGESPVSTPSMGIAQGNKNEGPRDLSASSNSCWEWGEVSSCI